MKIAQWIRPCGAFIFHILSNLSTNFSFGGPIPLSLHRWGEIWHGVGGEGPLFHAKFHPHRGNVSPLRGEKPHNMPLNKTKYRRVALREMLPVIINNNAVGRVLNGPEFTGRRDLRAKTSGR